MPFQGANETSGYKPQGDALGYVRLWAFSPSLLNPKLKYLKLLAKVVILFGILNKNTRSAKSFKYTKNLFLSITGSNKVRELNKNCEL